MINIFIQFVMGVATSIVGTVLLEISRGEEMYSSTQIKIFAVLIAVLLLISILGSWLHGRAIAKEVQGVRKLVGKRLGDTTISKTHKDDAQTWHDLLRAIEIRYGAKKG